MTNFRNIFRPRSDNGRQLNNRWRSHLPTIAIRCAMSKMVNGRKCLVRALLLPHSLGCDYRVTRERRGLPERNFPGFTRDRILDDRLSFALVDGTRRCGPFWFRPPPPPPPRRPQLTWLHFKNYPYGSISDNRNESSDTFFTWSDYWNGLSLILSTETR